MSDCVFLCECELVSKLSVAMLRDKSLSASCSMLFCVPLALPVLCSTIEATLLSLLSGFEIGDDSSYENGMEVSARALVSNIEDDIEDQV